MAGASADESPARVRRLGKASLREDYLNQVRRDCLSRTGSKTRLRELNTPSGCARPEAMRRRIIYRAPGATPSSLCSRGLVVVYCKGSALSGRSRWAMANAASVASWKPQTMSFFLPA